MKSILSRLWSQKGLRVTVWTLFTLFTLAVLALTIAAWRGTRHWEEVKVRLEQENESLDFRSITPDPVPDEQNFCAIPALLNLADEKDGEANREALSILDLATLADVKSLPSLGKAAQSGSPTDLAPWIQALTQRDNASATDLLDALSAQDSIVAELTSALDRPEARWTPEWRTRELPDFLFAIKLPHYQESQNLAHVFALRTLASVEAGDAAAAHDATRIILRFSQANDAEPFLIGLLVSVNSSNRAADSVWHLCSERVGTVEQFTRLEADLAKTDFNASALLAWRGELAASVSAIELLSRMPEKERKSLVAMSEMQDFSLVPAGILLQNAATVAELQLEYCLKPLKEGGLVAMHDRAAELETLIAERKRSPLLHPGSLLATLILPATTKISLRAIHSQTLITQAGLACALERHYLRHQSYPETLTELGAIPSPDLWTGKSMLYRKTSDGRYRLWSIGPDRVDDGGQRNLDGEDPEKAKVLDPAFRGDWVWDYTGWGKE